MTPIFLDCEASSLSDKSYPIEIAFSDENKKIESHLINPYSYPNDYTDWEPEAQAIHGLSRAYLSEHGKHYRPVAKRLNTILSGKKVYTDAPDFDEFWCSRLFGAANIKCQFTFYDINELLKKLLPCEYWFMDMMTHTMHIQNIKEQARKNCGLEAHRASNDVAYLIELYKLAKENGAQNND